MVDTRLSRWLLMGAILCCMVGSTTPMTSYSLRSTPSTTTSPYYDADRTAWATPKPNRLPWWQRESTTQSTRNSTTQSTPNWWQSETSTQPTERASTTLSTRLPWWLRESTTESWAARPESSTVLPSEAENYVPDYYEYDYWNDLNPPGLSTSDPAQSCENSYGLSTSVDTIIKTRESLENGAEFIHVPLVESGRECMQACCDDDNCNVAVFKELSNSCYLFDCGNPGTCLYTNHTGFIVLHLPNKKTAKFDGNVDEEDMMKLFTTTTTTTVSTTGNCDPEYEFRCDSGRCIQRSWVCDGDNDCADYSDEACPRDRGVTEYDDYDYRDHWDRISTTGRPQAMNDYDYGDYWDRISTTGRPQATGYEGYGDCDPEYEFRCANSGRCISKSWVCDGDNDCGDYSDEACPRDRGYCDPEHQFRCANSGRCISKSWVCDGENDCGDYSDEYCNLHRDVSRLWVALWTVTGLLVIAVIVIVTIASRWCYMRRQRSTFLNRLAEGPFVITDGRATEAPQCGNMCTPDPLTAAPPTYPWHQPKPLKDGDRVPLLSADLSGQMLAYSLPPASVNSARPQEWVPAIVCPNVQVPSTHSTA